MLHVDVFPGHLRMNDVDEAIDEFVVLLAQMMRRVRASAVVVLCHQLPDAGTLTDEPFGNQA